MCYYNGMLNKIIEYQNNKGLTNQAFADRIGYNRTSWIRVKSGRAPLNNKLIKRIEDAFPDIFLPCNTNIVACSSAKSCNTPLPLRARISRRLLRLLDSLYKRITARLIIDSGDRES